MTRSRLSGDLCGNPPKLIVLGNTVILLFEYITIQFQTQDRPTRKCSEGALRSNRTAIPMVAFSEWNLWSFLN